MKAVVDSIGHGRRALLLGALAVLLFAAILGLAADPAHAAFAARVQAGVLTVSGDSASDKLALRLQPGSPNILQVDVGDDGTRGLQLRPHHLHGGSRRRRRRRRPAPHRPERRPVPRTRRSPSTAEPATTR